MTYAIAATAQPVVLIKTFTASAQYFPGPGLTYAVIECVGAGGGSGGAVGQFTNTGTPNWIGGGGGGGSGSYSRRALTAAQMSGGVAVTVGAGGAAGTSTTAGGQGGDTAFGSFCIAHGGFGGSCFNNPASWGYGGHGGLAGLGDVAVYGASGGIGESEFWDPGIGGQGVSGGLGGAGFFGGTAQQVVIVGGPDALDGGIGAYGGGASGGASGMVGYPALGAAGGGGVCVVTEFYLSGQTSGASSVPCPTPVPWDPCGGWR